MTIPDVHKSFVFCILFYVLFDGLLVRSLLVTCPRTVMTYELCNSWVWNGVWELDWISFYLFGRQYSCLTSYGF